MLDFLVNNIFVIFAGKIPFFQQIIDIAMGTNWAPFLACILLCSYETDLRQFLLAAGRKRLASQFNFKYRYIDNVLSINNPDFENYLGQIYPLSLRSKTRRRATLLLPIWICSYPWVGMVNFAHPFTTTMMVLISILQMLRSWVATSHTPPPPPYGVFISKTGLTTPIACMMYVTSAIGHTRSEPQLPYNRISISFFHKFWTQFLLIRSDFIKMFHFILYYL